MRHNSVWMIAGTLGLLVQTVVASGAWAQGSDPVVNASSAITSVLATVVALPVKAATCVTTMALGGTGYGLTGGHSEFVQQELLAGLPYACGAYLHTTPQAVGQFTSEPE
jgi:hypothetical protein